MLLLLVLLTVIVLLYIYYSQANKKWSKRGLPGPEPELVLGNLRDVWDYERPRSIVLRDWTRKYGKMYGFYEGQRPFIVTSDFNIINEIVVKQHENFAARGRFVMQERKDGPNTKILEARGAHWKRLRALGSMAFTNKSLRNILPTLEESAVLAVDGMERHCGEEINMLEYFQEYTLDVICKIALGQRDVKMFNNEYMAVCREMFTRPIRHPITIMASILTFAVDEIRAALMFLANHVASSNPFIILTKKMEESITQRKLERDQCIGGEEKPRDFIDIFLDAEVDSSDVQFDSDTTRKLSADEIVGQCLVFLLAGFDTTANSLAYVTHFLANYPDVQQKLIDEIDAFLAEHEILDIESLSNLPYMDAVVKESLRHYPLGSVALTRECTRACEISGFRFEVGDTIAVDTWTMHMNREVWGEDAEVFRPERWLEPSSRSRTAFLSFGEGPRLCLGMRLAYLEEKVALIKLLQRFRVEKTDNTNPIRLVGSQTVSPQRVMVKLIKR